MFVGWALWRRRRSLRWRKVCTGTTLENCERRLNYHLDTVTSAAQELGRVVLPLGVPPIDRPGTSEKRRRAA